MHPAPAHERNRHRQINPLRQPYTNWPPERTDHGETAAPFLQVTERYAEPSGPKMTRAQMLEHLLTQHGCRCQGCDRAFDDPRYLHSTNAASSSASPPQHHHPPPKNPERKSPSTPLTTPSQNSTILPTASHSPDPDSSLNSSTSNSPRANGSQQQV